MGTDATDPKVSPKKAIGLIYDVSHLYTRTENDGGNYLVTWFLGGQTFSMASEEDKKDVNTAVF